MPTFINAHPWIANAVSTAGGEIIRCGSKPWAHFRGSDAAERARTVEEVYEQIHGYKCSGMRPWREGQDWDYAIRLD